MKSPRSTGRSGRTSRLSRSHHHRSARHWILGLTALLAPFTGTTAVSPSPTQPPNIVFILADDLGWTGLSCYGSDLHETPHLDRLSRQGLRFTQAYAMPVCSPTRAAILTGKNAARLNFTIWREGSLTPVTNRALLSPKTIADLPHSEVTLAEILKERGYLTFHVGKWHLGDADHYPESHGFDVNVGGTHWGAPETYFWPFRGGKRFKEFRYVPGLGVGQPGDYLTDRLTDEALRLMDQAGDRPFFLNLWYHNPHTPVEGKPDLVEHYGRKIKPGLVHDNPDYAALVHALDDNVGRLLKHLDDLGLADQTLVVFTSDNGGYINQSNGHPVTDNSPLRSGKGSLYEGGIRVPLIVRWPGIVPADSICHEPVVCMDFFPTLAGITGADARSAVDGTSLLGLFKNPAARLNRNTLFFHYPHYYATTTPVSAIREGDWKLLEYYEDRHVELFNLRTDPGEQHDLAGDMGEKANALKQSLDRARKAVDAQLPSSHQLNSGR